VHELVSTRQADREYVLNEIGRRRLVAVIRATDADSALFAAQTLIDAGVTAIEITFTTRGAADAIRTLARTGDSNALIGAGTVTNEDQALEAIDAGAAFLVSPHTALPVLELGTRRNTLVVPGVLTPTEIAVAREHAALLKLYPASLGGPSLLTALRGPYPDLRLMPTGGVNASNLTDWLAAGAYAIAAGTDLCPSDAIARRDRSEIRTRASRYLTTLETREGRSD
jgi:2-dehydro-3-deoxyphosphogluconate aldolase / (4S)-4-hydroxy-2-oxoglutarate aldolase